MPASEGDDETIRPSGSRESSFNDAQEDSGGGLRIPQAKDGFFGYTDEKNLQHVCCNQLFTGSSNLIGLARSPKKLGHPVEDLPIRKPRLSRGALNLLLCTTAIATTSMFPHRHTQNLQP